MPCRRKPFALRGRRPIMPRERSTKIEDQIVDLKQEVKKTVASLGQLQESVERALLQQARAETTTSDQTLRSYFEKIGEALDQLPTEPIDKAHPERGFRIKAPY